MSDHRVILITPNSDGFYVGENGAIFSRVLARPAPRKRIIRKNCTFTCKDLMYTFLSILLFIVIPSFYILSISNIKMLQYFFDDRVTYTSSDVSFTVGNSTG